MLWIYAHIVQTRATMLGLLDDPFDSGWGSLFTRGEALHEASRYPSRDDIDAQHRQIIDRLKARFDTITDADLATPARSNKVPGAKTVGDQLAFLAFHESYHIGQLAYVRKALGYSAIAG
jgi:uncharacterized damage-inducible protein DinB